MSTIIKSSGPTRGIRSEAFNFDDMATQADRYLEDLREKAVTILAQAQQQAETIRSEAEAQGRQAGLDAAEEIIERKLQEKLASLMAAMHSAVGEIEAAKQSWLQHWQQSGVRLATAIAERVIRRELSQQPEITLSLVREALELASKGEKVILKLNPQDQQTLGKQVETLVGELSRLAEVQVVADPQITAGGCVVETRFGRVDEQIEAQLARIQQELL